MESVAPGDRSFGDKERPGYEDCTGCNVCVLPCPVWRETHDITLTLAGRAKALQRGVPIDALAASLEACVLCGACEPVCPVEIDTVGMTLDLRAKLAEVGKFSLARNVNELIRDSNDADPNFSVETRHVASQIFTPCAPEAETRHVASLQNRIVATKALFLPGRSLRLDKARLQNVISVLEHNDAAAVIPDDGADIAIAMEAGLPVDAKRREQFLAPLHVAKELIVGDGLMHRFLREWLPDIRVIGIGEALLRLAPVRAALKPGDFYVIETRGYHAEFARLVKLYDGLRQSAGCSMNLDLQRAAIPTGAGSLQAMLGVGGIDQMAQTRWVVEGRKIERIVIEDNADRSVYENLGMVPVVHLAELAGLSGAQS